MKVLFQVGSLWMLFGTLSGAIAQSSAGNSPAQPSQSVSLYDGVYTGRWSPDKVLEKGCLAEGGYIGMIIFNGAVRITLSLEDAHGFIDSKGIIDVRGTQNLINLQFHDGEFVGRRLWGNGPWCKASVTLNKINGPPPPSSATLFEDGRYVGTATPDPNLPAICATVAFKKEMIIINGVAAMFWPDGTAYGYVYPDGHLELSSPFRTVKLERRGGFLSGRVIHSGSAQCKWSLQLQRD